MLLWCFTEAGDHPISFFLPGILFVKHISTPKRLAVPVAYSTLFHLTGTTLLYQLSPFVCAVLGKISHFEERVISQLQFTSSQLAPALVFFTYTFL